MTDELWSCGVSMESKLHLSTWQNTQCSRCHPPQPAVCRTPSDSHLQYITFNNLSPPLYMPHTLCRCVHSPLTEQTHFTKRNKLSTLSHQFYQAPLQIPASITDQISSESVEAGHRKCCFAFSHALQYRAMYRDQINFEFSAEMSVLGYPGLTKEIFRKRLYVRIAFCYSIQTNEPMLTKFTLNVYFLSKFMGTRNYLKNILKSTVNLI